MLSGEQPKSKVLAVGPLPPPFVGTTVSFELFAETVSTECSGVELTVINSSPGRIKELRRGSSGWGAVVEVSFTELRRAWEILRPFLGGLRKTDHVLVFGSSPFLLTLGPVLLLLAKVARKPCTFRLFGGSVDLYIERLPWIGRQVVLRTLSGMSKVLVQTELLRSYLNGHVERVEMVPGYRQYNGAERTAVQRDSDKPLRLAYVGLIKEEKGVFVLLEALRILGDDPERIHVDFYGSVPPSTGDRFTVAIEEVRSAKYCGLLPWTEVVSELEGYDALVHPTFYSGEGQPGVLIEAMMAGIPVISTDFRSIPELVRHGENGLLVTPGDSQSLAEAIAQLADDRHLISELGEANAREAASYDASLVVPDLMRKVLGS